LLLHTAMSTALNNSTFDNLLGEWDTSPAKLPIECDRPTWAEGLTFLQYKPINIENGELRLLTLQRGTKEKILRCRIQHKPPSTDTVDSGYTALSYTWGRPTAEKPIIIDDCLHYVTDNLEIALQSLRMENEDLVLWIDAICINQKDIAERNKHVKVMKEVYEQAKSVLIWLGPSADDSHLAMQTIRALNEVQEYWDRMQELQTLPAWMQHQALFYVNMMHQPRMATIL
jgi:hypothetical protein